MKIGILIPFSWYLSEFTEYLSRGRLSDYSVDVTVIPNVLFSENRMFYGKFHTTLSIVGRGLAILKYFLGRHGYIDTVLIDGISIAIPYLFINRLMTVKTPRIVVIHFYIHSAGKLSIVKTIQHFLLNNRSVNLVVQSKFEEEFYSSLASKCKVSYVPYCQEPVGEAFCPKVSHDYVFAGGYTNRDYACLIKAAETIEHQFLIVCSSINRLVANHRNVRVLQDVDKFTFNGYLKGAKIVVIPLAEHTGASGQMVALAAMSLSKPVIYADVDSVAQYFENGISGLAYRPGDWPDLRGKIMLLLSDPSLRETLGANAYGRYEASFRLNRYFDHVVSCFTTPGV